MRIGQKVALAGIAVSSGLALVKVVTGFVAGSTSVVASGLESAGDVLASGLVFLGLTLAAKPADSDHPYGHGRAETLTGLLVGLMLVGAGFAISFHSLMLVGEPHLPPAAYAIWPLIASIAIKSVLSATKYRVGKAIGSAALAADAWNDAVDIVSGLAALAAVGLTLYDPQRFLAADVYGGFAVGLIVIFTGLRVARDTGLQLMDTMPDRRMMQTIRDVAQKVSGVEGVEKCFARKTGLQYHVDLHLEVDPDITVRSSHDIAERVRQQIRHDVDWVADVLVHVEPSPRNHRMNGM
ncbi:MAG TPA: cation diffusion facilitator family transporter [Bryobacteraceae bacterium]|nr:cation diffusion facilitator family transporter [Bryobacteraceae bacterium]